ncbi:MAG TPA: HDIG domain-containing protein [Patescibacteria group bacterium]|nr:HDIG domain-containing protein [Patescibacteria group bacterium]
MQNPNLRKHCYSVEAVMGALYDRLENGKKSEEEKEKWLVAGLLHDADYELTKEDAKNSHTKHVTKWLEEADAHSDIRDAVVSHAWGFLDFAPEPKNKMSWALYCCDELTGLIIAVTLVKPDKKLASVTVESVMKKWGSQSFAAGVNRKQIEMCEEKLNLPLPEFIQIAISAMQGISNDLGL